MVSLSSWATGGYGSIIIIDHNNGYQTLSAHLRDVAFGCGHNIDQDPVSCNAGNTNNSTGTYLHIEVLPKWFS